MAQFPLANTSILFVKIHKKILSLKECLLRETYSNFNWYDIFEYLVTNLKGYP